MIVRHGLSIGIERTGDEYFLSFRGIGKLTHQDYQTITPMIDSALDGVAERHVKAFFDLSELEGWELHAAWDDFRLGLRHGKDFGKIAIFGHKGWQHFGAKVGAWFVSGEVRYFEGEDEALAWLNE